MTRIFPSICKAKFTTKLLLLVAIIPFSLANANEKVELNDPSLEGYGYFSCIGNKFCNV